MSFSVMPNRSFSLVDQKAIQQLFTEARSYRSWKHHPVSNEILKEIYNIMKFGPTAANGCPLRMVFIKSLSSKEKLKHCLQDLNVEKVMSAPVTVIFADDCRFLDHLEKLFPHANAKSWYEGNEALIRETAFRNATLQAAYFMIAARALGLDCGPISGFDNQMVDDVFFKGTSFKSNFICNLGYGDSSTLYPRLPRFDFDDVCTIL
jgi:3-hydroxypropanoate dehydrogenase